MTNSEIRDIDHMAYLVPFSEELNLPYRAPKKLKEMISYIFSHPNLPKSHRQLFIDVSQIGSRMVVNDMAVRAIAMCRYFVENPQQFGNSMENIQFQVLRRMWVQIFNHMWKQERYPTTEIKNGKWKYLGVKYKMLSIENGFWDELLRVVKDKDYHQTSDSMVKVREDLGLRERKNDKQHSPAKMAEGTTHFEYLCSLD